MRIATTVTMFIVMSIIAAGCKPQAQPQPQPRLTGKPIDEVLKENTPHLMSIAGVVGTAIGDCSGNPCIKVLVAKKTDILRQQIPSMLETWQVEIIESGEVKPMK